METFGAFDLIANPSDLVIMDKKGRMSRMHRTPFNHRKTQVEVVFLDKAPLRRRGGPAAMFPQP